MPWIECQCLPKAECPQGRDPKAVRCVVWRVTGQKMGLTERQASVLKFIRRFIAANGIPPTVREIADGIGGKSTDHAHHIVLALRERNHIDYVPRRARSIVVL